MIGRSRARSADEGLPGEAAAWRESWHAPRCCTGDAITVIDSDHCDEARRGPGKSLTECIPLCVFMTAVPIVKLFAWGEGESGGHVL